MNVTELPDYTKKTTLAGQILDVVRDRKKGFTQGLNLRSTPEKGYMVGTGQGEFNAKGMSYQQIKSKVNQIFNTYPQRVYLGAWRNGDDVIVEISKLVIDKNLAIDLGKAGKQIAIWDLENKKEIKLL